MVYKFDDFCNNFDASFLLFNIESGLPTDHRRVYLPWQLVNRAENEQSKKNAACVKID